MGKIKEYLNSSKLELIYKEDKLDVVNYSEIILITTDKIILSKDSQNIIIKGIDLSLLKLLDNEVLIGGSIKSIEM